MILGKELRRGNKFLSLFGNTETVLSIMDNTNNGKIKVIENPTAFDSEIHYKSENHKNMYSELIFCEENGNQYKPCELKGITLNKKILLQNGFKIKSEGDFYIDYKLNGLKIRYKKDNEKYFVAIWNEETKENEDDLELMYIECIHELQNLYFAIYKKDFIVNLKNNEND